MEWRGHRQLQSGEWASRPGCSVFEGLGVQALMKDLRNQMDRNTTSLPISMSGKNSSF